MTRIHEHFKERFRKWDDSYFTLIAGDPAENATLVDRPSFALIQFDGVEHALYESKVSEIDARNGISAEGFVRYSAKMSRGFTPGQGWSEWVKASQILRVDYLVKKGQETFEVKAVDDSMTAPTVARLYSVGIPKDSAEYWKQHVAKVLQPAFAEAEKESEAAGNTVEKAAVWRAFVLEQRKAQQLGDASATAPIIQKAAEIHAGLVRQQWEEVFKGVEGQSPMFGDSANLARNSSDHPLASGLQQIRKEHGSGLKGYFANRPTFTNSIGIKFVWCPENARAAEERARKREAMEGAARFLSFQKFSTRGFWISETELTRAQWAALMGTGANDPDLPLVNVSFEQGKLFCKLLTDCEQNSRCLPLQLEYDLPTEDEWEYARDTGGEVDPWQGSMAEQAWLAENSGGKIHPVKTLRANAWGIHDMIGNVEEHVKAGRGAAFAGGSFKDPLKDVQNHGASSVIGENSYKATSNTRGLRLVIRH